ncbi:MAG: FAD-dependent oxidoreductase [Chloroflexota bacterium]
MGRLSINTLEGRMGAKDAEVIVVGCGIAGLSAAVAAQEDGARVVVLERAPIDERGGNTRYTGAWMRMQNESDISDDFTEHFAANMGGPIDPSLLHLTATPATTWPPVLRSMSFADPEVVSTLAEEAAPTLRWLRRFGVRFARLETPFLTSVQPRIAPSGGGLAMIEALATHLERGGGTIHYEVAAQELIQGPTGAVEGVRCIGPGNRPVIFRTKATVLACGGFQGNAEMMAQYIGPRAAYLRAMSRGCYFNKGEGIRMALAIGAAPCGDYGGWHASPMDPRSDRAGPSIYIYPYGILVNCNGCRFVNEAPGPTDETYEGIGRAISGQPGGIAFAIVDASVADVPLASTAIRTEQPAVEAADLAQLAAKLDLPAVTLEESVAHYNDACVRGRFSPLELDGLSTRGLDPCKSNWARPVTEPPFQAWPIISSVVFTFGGLKVNKSAQALNTQGDPIPGLYVAGETMGLYYGSYTGATSVLKGAVFGRIAGTDAARRYRIANG